MKIKRVLFARALPGLLILALPWLLPSAASAAVPDPAVVAGFDELSAFIDGVPNHVLNKGQRQSFSAKLGNARKKYLGGDICTARNIMGAFLNEAQAFRRSGRAAIGEDLYNRGRTLRDSFFDVFLHDPNLQRPRCFDASLGREPEVQILASDNTEFSATVSFGAPRLTTVEAGGETWTQLFLPAIQSETGPPGTPALPSWQALVAIPHGSNPVLVVSGAPSVREVLNLNLYPFQPQAVDQDDEFPPPETFEDKPFLKDPQAYATDAFFPATPCAVRLLGSMRDMHIAQVQCTAGQYNPVTDELRLFDSLQFDVRFEGGDGNFLTSQSLNAFEPASGAVMGSALNSAVLTKYVQFIDPGLFVCLGEELLILTAPEFRAAADTLATWKRSKGIATTVINVGAGTAYDTATKIDQLIEHRYDTCLTRLSYLLLLGDSEWVPPSGTNYNNTSEPDATTGSDWGYATYPHLALLFLDALFPYFAVGRIPVDSLTEAQTVVNKIVNYESGPPFINFGSGGPFYTTASVVSQFQCCRTGVAQPDRDQRSFVQTSETARDTLRGHGYTVERIYTETGTTTPNRYYDGSLLPSDLRSGSGFPWSGGTANIISAFNAGRFLITHRDHGGPTQWVNPPFTTGNLGSLTNGALLPVIYSVNCKSAYWDSETDGGGSTESLMEQLLLKSNGGMVGGIGDVRNSPTWPNSALLRGFVDATWPDLAPAFGSNTSKRRLGDILDHGKLYLATQVGVAQPAGDITLQDYTDEIVLYHAIGDPTQEMWTSNPYRIVLPLGFELAVRTDRLIVQYAQEGAEITALQLMGDGSVRPLARGPVRNGTAELPYIETNVGPFDPRSIILSASFPNAVSVLLQAGQVPQPDLVIRQLELGESTFVTTGEDLAGRLQIEVANIGDADAPGTVNADGSPKPAGTGYAIDAVLSADGAMPPGFATLPLPAGQAFAEDGLLQGGRVSRTQDVAAASEVLMPVGPPISNDVGGVIPLLAPPGNMFLCARIDPGDAVAESNEDNNVTCIGVLVEPIIF
jgi:hypothetical protein